MLEVRTDSGLVRVDARPSDAIALALRSGARIFVADQVIQNARSFEASRENIDVGRLQKWLEGLSEEEIPKYKM
jgi:bifunctional DNase/RNase